MYDSNTRAFSGYFKPFAFVVSLSVAGIVTYYPEVDRFIAEPGERLYVSVYGALSSHDIMPPDWLR